MEMLYHGEKEVEKDLVLILVKRDIKKDIIIIIVIIIIIIREVDLILIMLFQITKKNINPKQI